MRSIPAEPTWQPELLSRELDVARVEAIAFTPMPPWVRNELITLTYADLAAAMADLLGPEHATWCALGQWASFSVGSFLDNRVPAVGRAVTRAFGDGNRDVFTDVGLAHVHFLETVGRAHRTGGDLDEAWQACRRRLDVPPIVPPSRPTAAPDVRNRLAAPHRADPTAEGNRTDREVLVRGLQAYREALATTDPEVRARRVLLGNALVALHEQQLVGPALSVGFRAWLRLCTTGWKVWETRYHWRNRPPGKLQLRLESRWIRIATRRLVKVDLPGGPLAVSERIVWRDDAVEPLDDLVAPRHTTDLAGLDPDVLLSTVWQLFEVDGRPATCWADLRDRMAFILAVLANEQRHLLGPGVPTVPARPEALAEARAIQDRIGPPAPPPRRPDPEVASPHDRATLDELRRRPTHHFDLALRTVPHHEVVRAIHEERPEVADVLADFHRRFDAVTAPGGLLDPHTVRDARGFFDDWSTLQYMGLLFRALPEGYAAAHGVAVLGRVSDLATHPVRRVGETAHFLKDLFERPQSLSGGTLAVDGPAARSVLGVRAIHAMIGMQLVAAGWDTEAHGLPFNQEDVLGTMCSFVVPPIEMLEHLRLGYDPAGADAYTRFWCGIGHLLGLPLDLVTHADGSALRFEEARALSELIRDRHHRRSLDGVRLAEALTEGAGDGFPRSADWLATGLLAAVGSAETNRLLLVQEGRGRRMSRTIARTLSVLLRFPPSRPPTRGLVTVAGRIWLRPFLLAGTGRPFRRRVEDLWNEVVAEAGLEKLERHQPEDPPRPLPSVLDREVWPEGCGVGRISSATPPSSRLLAALGPVGRWLPGGPDRR